MPQRPHCVIYAMVMIAVNLVPFVHQSNVVPNQRSMVIPVPYKEIQTMPHPFWRKVPSHLFHYVSAIISFDEIKLPNSLWINEMNAQTGVSQQIQNYI